AASTGMLVFGWFYVKLYIQKPRTRLLVYFPALIFLTGVLAGGVLLSRITENIELEEKRGFLQLGRSVAAAIDPGHINSLKFQPGYDKNRDAARLARQLELVRQANPERLAFYIAARHGEKIRFLIPGARPQEQPVAPGEIWRNPPQELERAFAASTALISKPYLFGVNQISCFVPITNPGGKSVMAVLGIDMEYHQWLHDIYARKFPNLLVVSLLMLLVVCFFVFYEFSEKSDREIYEREQRLRTILASIAEGVIVTDLNGQISFANPVALSLTGRTRREICNHRLHEVFRIGDGANTFTVPDGIHVTSHSLLAAKGGKTTVVATSIAPLSDQNGETTGSVVIFRDMTEALSAEEELRHAHDFNDAIITNMPHVFFILDRSGRFVKWNNVTCALIGLGPEEMRGVYAPAHVMDRYRPAVEEILRSWPAEPQDVEMRIVTADGIRDFRFSSMPLRNGGEDFLIIYGRDVTIFKQKDEQLRLAAEEWAQSFDSIPDIMFITDTQYRILRTNAAFRRRTGIADATNKNCHDIFSGGDFAWLCQRLECTDFTKAPGELEVFNPDTRTSLLVINSHLLDSNGELKGLVFAIRDITDLKRAAQEMRSAAEMKSQFLSVASHELRTPLSAIKDSIDIVAEDDAALEPQQREMISIAKRNIDRLSRLINNILDFQRLEAGRQQLHIVENDLGNIIEEVCLLFNNQAAAKGIRLELGFAALPVVKLDRDMIVQVLANLVGNAIKFTDHGGVTVSALEDAGRVRVTVSDTGPGIKAEDLSRLFQKFEQVGDNAGRIAFGTGLGLVIARHIIELHGGKIWAESDLRTGTSFIFELPVQ
ncbi:MAG: PAS domain S-box protein, partial [Elusimicrobiaceae bacterium]|nr:PAS domain S-box protein [Elusimicrobiaceae bacterium]